MTSEPRQPDEADQTYRALGRFVVAFSHLVASMQAGVISVAGIGRGAEPITALQITLAEANADQVRRVFFSTCTALTDLTDDEKTIRNKLNTPCGR